MTIFFLCLMQPQIFRRHFCSMHFKFANYRWTLLIARRDQLNVFSCSEESMILKIITKTWINGGYPKWSGRRMGFGLQTCLLCCVDGRQPNAANVLTIEWFKNMKKVQACLIFILKNLTSPPEQRINLQETLARNRPCDYNLFLSRHHELYKPMH